MSNDDALIEIITELTDSPVGLEAIRSFFLSLQPVAPSAPSPLSEEGAANLSLISKLAAAIGVDPTVVSCVMRMILSERYYASLVWDACELQWRELHSEALVDGFSMITTPSHRPWRSGAVRRVMDLEMPDYFYAAQRAIRSSSCAGGKLDTSRLQSCYVYAHPENPDGSGAMLSLPSLAPPPPQQQKSAEEEGGEVLGQSTKGRAREVILAEIEEVKFGLSRKVEAIRRLQK